MLIKNVFMSTHWELVYNTYVVMEQIVYIPGI